MATSISKLSVFDDGQALACGTTQSIKRGDKIQSFQVQLAHVPKSSEINLGKVVSTNVGRKVYGAIWLVSRGNDISRTPDYISYRCKVGSSTRNQGYYDTNTIPTATSGYNIPTTDCTFIFTENMDEIDGTSVIVGLWTETDDAEGSLAVVKKSTGTMYYRAVDKPTDKSGYRGADAIGTERGALDIIQISTIHYSGKEVTTKLQVTSVVSRLLSAGCDADDNQTILPSSQIRSGSATYSTQWNTKSSHPWSSTGGYDFKQGQLEDMKLNRASINDDNTTAENNLWVHPRARILLTFDSAPTLSSRITYKISETKQSHTYTEKPSTVNTLLLCPRDEGISDNEPMTVTLQREIVSTNGSVIAKSAPVSIYFHTYANPSVSITYPKNITVGGKETNFALWAQEILNEPYSEDPAQSEKICAALNILLSKNGGDNSGIPMYTRVSITEIKGEYGKDGKYDGTFAKPSNTDILGYKLDTYTHWTGVFEDTGNLIQLTGLKKWGMSWDFQPSGEEHSAVVGPNVTERDNRIIFRSGYKYLINVRRFHGAVAGIWGLKQSYASAKGAYTYTTPGFPGMASFGGGPDQRLDISDFSQRMKQIPSADWLDRNNCHAMQHNSEGKNISRWLGPQDSYEGIATGYKEYPGFSESAHIIVDCVNAFPSISNLLLTRPATQEIGADHWLTFAYRHMNKTPTGIDYTTIKSKEATITSSSLLADGSFNKSEKEPVGNIGEDSWGLSNTTARRNAQMYNVLVCHIIEKLKSEIIPAKLTELCPEHAHQVTAKEIEYAIWVDRQTGREFSLDSDIREDDTEHTCDMDLLYHQKVSSGTISYDKENCIRGGYGMILKHPPTADDAQAISKTFGKNSGLTGFQLFSHADNGEGTYYVNNRYGNEYRWWPIINNTTGSGNTKLPTIKEGNIVDYNNLKSIADELPSTYEVNYSPLQTYALVDVNTQNMDHSIPTATTADAADNNCNKNIAEWNESLNYVEGATITALQDGGLYTSQAMTDINCKTTDARGVIIASHDNNKTPSQPSGSQFFANTNITNAGQLYLRVPPSQDCENGTPCTWCKPLPSRIELSYPLVRCTHMLYYNSWLYGNLRVTVRIKYGVHDPQYDEEGEYTGCEEAGDETTTIQYTMEDLGLNDVGKSITVNGKTYNHVLKVFGEDNGGLGRCLSADDYSNLTFESATNIHQLKDSGYCGGIEAPIRVRYTPLVQPQLILEKDDQRKISKYATSPTLPTHSSNNIISLVCGYDSCSARKLKYYEYNSQSIEDDLRYKEKFQAVISYGMYRSSNASRYYTSHNSNGTDTNMRFNKLLENNFTDINVKANDYNKDIFPTVGICNAFMILLVPHGAGIQGRSALDWTQQGPNWIKDRSHWEDSVYVTQGAKKIYPVIVADLKKDAIYSMLPSDSYEATDALYDHINRTLLVCDFNYTDLMSAKTVQSDVGDSNVTKRNHTVQEGVWYDLVAVPIFTNRNGFGSTEQAGPHPDFQYKDGAGSISGEKYAGGSAAAETIDYYGSSPLVIEKFLQIARVEKTNKRIIQNGNSLTFSACGGGGGGGSDPEPTPPEPETNPVPPPFATEGCIVYPNVNNIRYNCENGLIRECPGFWLDNTFRVIVRAPHYRTDSEIQAGLGSQDIPLESSFEEMTGGDISDKHEYEFSDVMIHIGKYWGPVNIKESNGEFSKDTAMFSDAEFQQQINLHALDTEWLNDRGIYTIRTNPEAFSKRVPEVVDDATALRDTIKAGSLDANDERYWNRFFEFNPAIVGASTPDDEGYYIQVRFLNANYPGSSQCGRWTEWCGGILNDAATYDTANDVPGGVWDQSRPSYLQCRKDVNLEYYVPVRNYNDVYTEFRNFIKESVPGSGIRYAAKSVSAYETSGGETTFSISGAGTQSPNLSQGPSTPAGLTILDNYIQGEGNTPSAKVVPAETVPTPQYTTIDESTGSSSTYKPHGDNKDYPYPPMLKDSEIPLSSLQTEYNQLYWEAYYLEYIIHNMCKLYYSEWDQGKLEENKELNPLHLGWNAALAHSYRSMQDWDKWLDAKAKSRLQERLADADTPSVIGEPLNTEPLYREIITSKEFEFLQSTLETLVEKIRDKRFTGTHTSTTDKKTIAGQTTGYSVMPIGADGIAFSPLRTDGLVSKGTIIGHSASANDADKSQGYNQHPYFIESNRIRQLFDTILTKILQQPLI